MNAAVLEAYRAITMSLHALLIEADVSVTQLQVCGAGLAKLPAEKGLIAEETARAVEALTVPRNLASHGLSETTRDRAAEYLVLVESLLKAIENPSKRP